MAQVRKKRQTKHRGNAAGIVESRGRTGRKPTDAEKKGPVTKESRAKSQPVDRRNQPPSWRRAFIAAMFAAILLLLVMTVLFKKPTQGVALFPFVLLLYVPISYYTDSFFYKRRVAAKARAKSQ
ncbi:MAG TPA: hypothetical protein VMA83_00680 [Solirubrobacteraceae bacterium]|nr:hypothetical protein [Solirubrobacteraceae bacterium]